MTYMSRYSHIKGIQVLRVLNNNECRHCNSDEIKSQEKLEICEGATKIRYEYIEEIRDILENNVTDF